MYRLYFFIVFLLAMSNPLLVVGQEQEKDSVLLFLEDRDKRLRDAIYEFEKDGITVQEKERIQTMVTEILDFDMISMEAIKGYENKINTEKYDQYHQYFSRLLYERAVHDIDVYKNLIVYDQIKYDKDDVWVYGTIKTEKNTVYLEYILHQVEKRWFIKDIIIDNISTVESYKEQFDRIIRQKGIDFLIKILKNRINKEN